MKSTYIIGEIGQKQQCMYIVLLYQIYFYIK